MLFLFLFPIEALIYTNTGDYFDSMKLVFRRVSGSGNLESAVYLDRVLLQGGILTEPPSTGAAFRVSEARDVDTKDQADDTILVWKEEQKKHVYEYMYKPFETLTISSGATTWNTKTGLNKTLTASANFTLNITNLASGMSGALTIELTGTATITLSTGQTNIGNNSLTGLLAGNYVLAFLFDGTSFHYNIDQYA